MAVVVTSMTGFARAEGRLGGKTPLAWSWETKSVNGKNLEVRVRVPHGYEALEIPARQAASALFARGSVNLLLNVTTEAAPRESAVDEALLDSLIALANRKAGSLPAGVAPAALDGLMALAQSRSGAEIVDAEAVTARDNALLAGLKAALGNLAKARAEEGAKLGAVVADEISTIDGLCAEAKVLAAMQPEAMKARLLAQVSDLAGAVPALSPERLAQETVLLAVKYDLREELDRLTAHVAQAREILAKGEPCGRKLDFLSQEFNREANTLCSKSADLALTRVGIALKTTIDQFREQVQNIE
ncbi:MAG: YicC/YloC family endoribonuclease [Rhodospirillaceae bacterium]